MGCPQQTNKKYGSLSSLTNFHFIFLKASHTETAKKKYQVNMTKRSLDLVTESITVSSPVVSTYRLTALP